MFKSARWRNEKNRVKAVFKFQFHVTQVPLVGWETMVVSLVPLDVGKPSLKSDKAEVVNGECQWLKPVFETARLVQDPKSMKFNEKFYQFLVSSPGSTKAGLLGETSINLADYAQIFKPYSVSLPLKGSNSGAILHLTVQRIEGEDVERRRETEENGDTIIKQPRKTLQSQLSNGEIDGTSSVKENLFTNGELRKSSSFESASGSDSSSGQYTPKGNGTGNGISLAPLNPINSSAEWSLNSALDGNMDELAHTSGDNSWRERLHDPNVDLEKLRSDAIALVRQLDVSELELQTLRKQVVKESKRGQELSFEIGGLKDERDAARRECEEFKASLKRLSFMNTPKVSKVDDEDLRSVLEEIKEELSHEKSLNANLRFQLEKTQESNSELILAVRELDELLEQKEKEIGGDNSIEVVHIARADEDFSENGNIVLHSKSYKHKKELPKTMSQHDDEDQYALEVLVKGDAGVTISLEQQIIDLKSELELYAKEREEMEMQMEQIALDYEIMKQENHDLSSKLEQIQLREQLRMQYECSAHLAIINDLESHVAGLEKELAKQAEQFRADLETVTQAKIKQEQRAIQAEEAMRKIRWRNANTAERLQEEFRVLSSQLSSTFDANEKLATKAMKEASELQLEKCHLEELLEKANDELELVHEQHRAELEEQSKLLDMKTNEANELLSELENKSAALENQKKLIEEMRKAYSEEIERLLEEKNDLAEQVQQKEDLVAEIERLTLAVEESERMLKDRKLEKEELEREISSVREEMNKSLEELSNLRSLSDEKETMIQTLNCEVETLQVNSSGMKHSLLEDELEKEKLRKQISHLVDDLQKKDDMIARFEKKLKENNARHAVTDAAAKTSIRNKNSRSNMTPQSSKEVSALREKVRILQEEMKLKNAELEETKNLFIKKEKDLNDKIEELGRNREGSNCEGMINKDNLNDEQEECICEDKENALKFEQENKADGEKLKIEQGYIAEILSEVAALKQRNESMEAELKEMQERYSDISLKFAEVEGERQQLVMRIRSLKNSMKN
ncbi:centromere-associated protein E-like isoform X2 [Dioscorea cayenensis subsp. rotundata]|uniref:Centromere-associated protein E-like isoform X2 n=1 Tax=Dioscorea cayennensis subsp. rotundata TaxID=55577 RepID=A0AB40CK71_DIOCR|nr:centromere-associated protein E-like isoform X2 [Dioscorea cayenensis subsp. rotundata]